MLDLNSRNKFSHIKLLIKTLIILWKFSKSRIIALLFFTVINSFFPAVSIWITKQIIDSVAKYIQTGGQPELFYSLLYWIGVELIIRIASAITTTVNNILNGNFTEAFTNHVNLLILNKCSQLDIAFFENSEFYNKLEMTRQGASGQLTSVLIY